MIKWDLVLGTEAFYYFWHQVGKLEKDRGQIKKYQDLLEQHNIVLSTTLRDLYEKYFDEYAHNEFDELERFFDDLNTGFNSDPDEFDISFINVSPVSEGSVDKVMSLTVDSQTLKKPFLVCDSDKQTKDIKALTKVPMTDRSEVPIRKMANRIYRNSITFSKDMLPSDYSEYVAWLQEAFYGEYDIDIIDPYFQTDKGLLSFSRYYIKHIPNEANLNIYTSDKQAEYLGNWDLLFTKAREKQLNVHIFVVDKSTKKFDFHERRIYLNTSHRHLAIGHGIDTVNLLFDENGISKPEMKDCHLTIDDDYDYRDFFFKNCVYTELTMDQIYG